MVAVNCVELPYVVARFEPFHCTCDPFTNPLPVTVSVNAPNPAAADTGESALTAGAGLFTVNVTVAEVPPPTPPGDDGFTTVTAMVPAAAKSAVVIAAVSCVERSEERRVGEE